MDIEITFPGGKRVDARVGNHTLHTDQPVALHGEDSAPAPFDLFLASLGTCAGIYVLGFLEARSIPTEGLRLTQRVVKDEASGLPQSIALEITLPEGFPEKYRGAVLKAAEHCKVKKTIEAQPTMTVALASNATERGVQHV